MNTIRTRLPAWVGAVALVSVAAGARAAEFPKSGEAEYVRYQVARIVGTVTTPLGKGIVFEDTSITRNVKGEGPFDGLVDRCLGQFTVVGEDWTRGFGTCAKHDKDGDTMLVTWEGDNWKIVSGTGKYKGITGTGTTITDPAKDLLEDRPDGWIGTLRHTVKWKID